MSLWRWPPGRPDYHCATILLGARKYVGLELNVAFEEKYIIAFLIEGSLKLLAVLFTLVKAFFTLRKAQTYL